MSPCGYRWVIDLTIGSVSHYYTTSGLINQNCGFDELTHFTESQFFYMMTRNRSTSGVKPYMRGTCNPDPDSWVAKFIEWWIDPETGLPVPERSGAIRYFTRVDNVVQWADTPEELQQTMRERYPTLSEESIKHSVKSFTFIPAKLDDNKILMEKDPAYIANLLAQDEVEQARLKDGNWKVRAAAGKIVNREWFRIIPAAPEGGEVCIGWDFASTAKELKGRGRSRDPDYTAYVVMKRVRDRFYVLDFWQKQIGSIQVEEEFKTVTQRWAKWARASGASFKVRWGKGKADAGDRDNIRLTQMMIGLDAAGVDERGDKFERGAPFAAQAKVGGVDVVAAPWNDAYLSHLHGQPDLAHDDGWDANSTTFNALADKTKRTRQGGGVFGRNQSRRPKKRAA